LGNPGEPYRTTRHNAGHQAIAWCADSAGVSFQKFKSHGHHAAVRHPSGVTLRLATLTSYMNLSGSGTQAMLRFFSIPPSQLIVVHDELDLAPGVVRLKWGGGHAGHNGLRDIARALGTTDFYRVRIGIGRPADNRPVADYVLDRWSAEEAAAATAWQQAACRGAEAIAVSGLQAAQQLIHPPASTA